MVNLAAYPLLPDEHLFSRIARFHWLSGNATTAYTREKLGISTGAFKAQNVLNHVYETCITASLTHDTQPLNDLLSEHSLFNHFRIGTPKSLVQSRIDRWRSGTITHDVHQYSLNDRMIVVEKHWRSCPACTEEDIQTFGIAYWHTNHQIPGLNFCTKHRTPLWSGCQRCNTHYSTLNDFALPEIPCACDEPLIGLSQPRGFQAWLLNNLQHISKCDTICVEQTLPAIKDLLQAPSKATAKNNPEINRIRDLVEEVVGLEELGQIFMYYRDRSTQFRGSPRPNIVKAALYGPSGRVRHPIYYWILLYAGKSLAGQQEWPVVA